MPEEKQKILNFLKTQYLGVISTVDSKNNKSESALVAFALTENLEMIVGTFNDTRKFENIQLNPTISFVAGFDHISIQYEGTAKIAVSEEIKECEQLMVAKKSSWEKYIKDPKERFLKISPTWIRYVDYSPNPHLIFEIKF
jgi:general stress protein 26